MSLPARFPERMGWARRLGPILAGLGLAVVAAIALEPAADRSLVAWWILSSALAPERVLPLLGLGVALALARRWPCVAGVLLFAGGIGLGFPGRDWFLSVVARAPQAEGHGFLTAPIAAVSIGVALAPGTRIGSWLLSPAAAVNGLALALAIGLTDPSLHDPAIPLAGVGVGLWIVAATGLTLRAVRRPWLERGAQILGSWLLAIGLLNGAAALVPRRQELPPPLSSPVPAIPPESGTRLPDLGGPRHGYGPEGLDRSREP